MPSALERAAGRLRRELLNNERQAASAMVRVYGESWRAVSLRVFDLQRRIAEAQAAGAAISPAWFYQYNRAQSLQAQIEAELRRFGVYAAESTTGLQGRAVEAARRHSAELVDLAAGVRPAGIEAPFDVLPAAALQDLVGFAADGSPLREVYGEIAGGVADRVTDTMVSAVAAGLGPRETARLIRRQFGTGLARALLVSRTETLRAYREAAHRNYEANSDVLEGWIWYATLGPRTCAACFAMHGSFHELKEHMASHPNCRCTPVPALKPWKALGYDIPDNRPVIEPGEAAFARLTAAEQEQVLGKAAFAAWQDGAVSLAQFAAHKHSAEWGDTVQVASLRDVLGRERARGYIEQVRAARMKTVVTPMKLSHYRQLQDTRLAEVQAMVVSDLQRLRMDMVTATSLPKLNDHFRKHSVEFAPLGIMSPDELNRLFLEHIRRQDLRIFTYVSTQAMQYRHWAMVGMDNGVIVLYNESRRSHWSMICRQDISDYLQRQNGWWIEILDWTDEPKARRL